MDKLDKNITIHIGSNLKNEIDIIAAYYQRKPAELVRLLLTPVIINEYAKIQLAQQAEKPTLETAIFRG